MKRIAAGSFSAALSRERGELYLWGAGTFGHYQSPVPVNMQQSYETVAIGNQFGVAVTASGGVYTWGVNANGELGQGD